MNNANLEKIVASADGLQVSKDQFVLRPSFCKCDVQRHAGRNFR